MHSQWLAQTNRQYNGTRITLYGFVKMTIDMPGTIGGAKLIFKPSTGKITMYSTKIAIIGLGFVGGAIRDAIDGGGINLVIIDQDPTRGTHTYADIPGCDAVFVCVPSPQADDGTCDTSILESVLEKLRDYDGVIISKCTAPPSTYGRIGKTYKNLVHAPEFLTAANASKDYINGSFSIIGGSVKAYMNEAARIIKITQPLLATVDFCTIEEAALAKYAINSFLSTKVVYMNELQEVAEAAGLDYDKIAFMVIRDKRIGRSHMLVPGPDGAYGFGGTCFPKDTSALLKYAQSIGVNMNVLDAAVRKNTLLRLKDAK